MGRNKQAVAFESKQKRQQERRRIGRLGDNVVLPGTLERYRKAVINFFMWLFIEGTQIPRKMWDMDPVLSEYIEHLWEEGEGVSFANDAFAGLLHYRERLKHYLPKTRKLLKTWNKKELPARAPPFSISLLFLLVDSLRESGAGEMALGCLIMFFLILRTGELASITRGDIQFAPDNNSFILNLGMTKVGVRSGVAESVTCELPWLTKIMLAWAKGKLPGDRLVSKGIHSFRRCFSNHVSSLGLNAHIADASLHFKPYSLRRGGATYHFRVFNSLSRLCVYGRWNNPRTCRIYVNEGLALQAKYLALKPSLKKKVEEVLKKYHAPLSLLAT